MMLEVSARKWFAKKKRGQESISYIHTLTRIGTVAGAHIIET